MPRGSPQQQYDIKLITTPTVCRPDPRTTPLHTPLNGNETFKKRNTLLKRTIKKTGSKEKWTSFDHASPVFHSMNQKLSLTARLIVSNLETCGQRFSARLRFFAITGNFCGSLVFMSLQRILMNRRIIAKLCIIN